MTATFVDRFRKGLERKDKRVSAPRESAPLYTVAQAQASLKQLNPVDYDLDIAPHPQVRARHQKNPRPAFR